MNSEKSIELFQALCQNLHMTVCVRWRNDRRVRTTRVFQEGSGPLKVSHQLFHDLTNGGWWGRLPVGMVKDETGVNWAFRCFGTVEFPVLALVGPFLAESEPRMARVYQVLGDIEGHHSPADSRASEFLQLSVLRRTIVPAFLRAISHGDRGTVAALSEAVRNRWGAEGVRIPIQTLVLYLSGTAAKIEMLLTRAGIDHFVAEEFCQEYVACGWIQRCEPSRA